MNNQKRSYRARLGALAVSVAVTMAAAIGLTTASEHRDPRAASTDSGAPSLPTNAPNNDPELMRIDRANEHHG